MPPIHVPRAMRAITIFLTHDGKEEKLIHTHTHRQENVQPKKCIYHESVEVNPFALFEMDEDE